MLEIVIMNSDTNIGRSVTDGFRQSVTKRSTSSMFPLRRPSLGFELFKRIGQEMVKRLQSARGRLLKAEATGFSPVGAEHPIYGA